MDKGKTLDSRFEQIDALNAKVVGLKMQLGSAITKRRDAVNNGKKELVDTLNKAINTIMQQIESTTDRIKNINEEIKKWRQTRKRDDENEKRHEDDGR